MVECDSTGGEARKGVTRTTITTLCPGWQERRSDPTRHLKDGLGRYDLPLHIKLAPSSQRGRIRFRPRGSYVGRARQLAEALGNHRDLRLTRRAGRSVVPVSPAIKP